MSFIVQKETYFDELSFFLTNIFVTIVTEFLHFFNTQPSYHCIYVTVMNILKRSKQCNSMNFYFNDSKIILFYSEFKNSGIKKLIVLALVEDLPERYENIQTLMTVLESIGIK